MARVMAGVGGVAAGTMVANICGYLIHLPAARWLSESSYGEFAVLLQTMLVLGVPALALQVVIAREVVHGRPIADLVSITIRTAAAVLGAAVIAVPIVMWIADTGLASTIAAFATAPLLVLIAAGQGILQGRQQFSLLSWVLAGVGVARTVPGIVVITAGGGAAGALAATAVGAAVSAAGVWVAVSRTGSESDRHPGARALALTMVLRASQVQLVLIALSSVDLLLSRPVLGEQDAGVYALGTIATKAAFWLPQAIGVVLFPQFADTARSSAALRTAVGWLLAIAVVVVGGAAILAPLAPVLVGDEYRAVVPILWIFALTGSALSILQVGLLAAIARDQTLVAALSWLVFVVEVVIIVAWAHSITTLALTAAGCAVIGTALTLIAPRVSTSTTLRRVSGSRTVDA
ncbi:polysaccharide biosynthesis protein [Williamsia sp. 1135]|uniref:lipopolysaccharide biosynthesis protein n=1 Tax=Williamsia sp. 1135 TaxID=1889262 RepID=UPI001F0A103E|nr:polysaccharide biosynthesis protein [Williamsia sp. 1135]